MALTVEGKTVYSDINEVVVPQHSALLVLDMQRYYCHPEGVWAGRYGTSLITKIVPRVQDLINMARAAGARAVIYLQTVTSAGDGRGAISPAYLRSLSKVGVDSVGPIEGTWGAEILDELKPAKNDIVVKRFRFSGFVHSPLDLVLRSNGVETAIIAGVFTHSSVDSTARDSALRGYYPVVVADCVASYKEELHDAALKILDTRVDLVTCSELKRIWGTG